MPPRREDDEMMVHVPSSPSRSSISPASQPNLFELPKDVSFLALQQPSLKNHAHDIVRQRMSLSLDRAVKRGELIEKRLNNEAHGSVVREACRAAIGDELKQKIKLADHLLKEANSEDSETAMLTKDKRVSVALVTILQYLDTLDYAMAFSWQDRLEAGIHSILDSIALNSKEDSKLLNDSLNVCVSSWKAPLLAFDFQVGSPEKLSVSANRDEPTSLPIEIEVRPIVEYAADALIEEPKPQTQMLGVKVKKCSHKVLEYGSRDGTRGQATVQVHVAPLSELKNKREAIWGAGTTDVEKVNVKEVRATQQNAYPTKFRINFDMFSSSVYGERGITLTLNLETCQAMDCKVPKVHIDLVIEP